MEGGVISLPVPAPAPVSCLANREFQATPTPSPPDESTVLRELNVSVSLAGLDISRGHHGEPDVLGQRRSKCKPKVRTVSKMHMVAKAKARAEKAAAAAVDKAKAEKAAALDKAKSEKKVAADKAKAEKAAGAANDKAKTEKKQAAADDKAKAEKKAAPAGGAASPDLLRLDLYLVDGYGIKEQRMVKMDHRNSYIKWLLEWDKKPRRPLPNLPMAPKSMAAIKAQRDHDERVLADFKRNGYAYVQVDVFNDDDPRANLADHHYDIIHHDSHEVA